MREKRGGGGKLEKEKGGEGIPNSLEIQGFPTSPSEYWDHMQMSPCLVTGKLLTN